MEDLPFSFGRTKVEKILVVLVCLALIGAVLASIYYQHVLTMQGVIEGKAIALYNEEKDAPLIGLYFGKIPRGAAWGDTFWLISGVNDTSLVTWNYTSVPDVIEVKMMYENTTENAWLPWEVDETKVFPPYGELHIKLIMLCHNATGNFQVKVYFNQWEVSIEPLPEWLYR